MAARCIHGPHWMVRRALATGLKILGLGLVCNVTSRFRIFRRVFGKSSFKGREGSMMVSSHQSIGESVEAHDHVGAHRVDGFAESCAEGSTHQNSWRSSCCDVHIPAT